MGRMADRSIQRMELLELMHLPIMGVELLIQGRGLAKCQIMIKMLRF